MELPLVIVLGSVLTLVTLVTATPYGYGVKSGASAKAEASAVAGPFGNVAPVPLSIPSGASYSGSFSKSSASSFASSSASSSASSFSFSGSGANGIPDIAGSGSKGCSTGSCPGGGATGSPLSGAQPFGGANAVATAQAKAFAGSYAPCQGSKCIGLPEKCTSGQCSTNSDNNHKAEDESSNSGKETSSSEEECTSGQCDKEKESGDSDDSNDFAVNIDRNSKPKSSQDVSGQYSNKQKPLEPGCSNGKCGSTTSYTNSATYNQNQHRQPVPATYLTTPNHNEPCTTPNCNYPGQGYGPQNGGLPSSYNVPLHTATNAPSTSYPSSGSNYGPGSPLNHNNNNNPSVPCTSANCNSGSTSNIPHYPFGQKEPNNQGNCISGNCEPHSPEKPLENDAGSGINTPIFSHGAIPSNRPGSSGQPGCTTPNCAQPTSNHPNLGSSTVPAYSTLPAKKQNNNCIGTECSGPSYTGSPTKPSSASVYTGGFGGPPGSIDTPWTGTKLRGNSGNQYSSTHTPGFSKPNGYYGTPSSNNLGSNNHYGSAPTPGASGPTGTYEYNKPSLPSPSSTHPSYTGSFSHPGKNGVPSSTTFNHGSSPSYNNGLQDNIGATHSNSGYNAFHGSFGVTKPSTAPNFQTSPTYTGGFGRPTGTSLTGVPKPGSSNCGPSGCNGQSTSYDIAGIPSHAKPTYTGGFGGPTGTLGPQGPTSGPGVHKPETENCGYAGCNSSPSQNTGTTAGQNHPTYTGGFGGPTGTLGPQGPSSGPGIHKPETENCGYAGCNSSPSQNTGTTVGQNHPTYNGGFGGPTGTLSSPYPTPGHNGVNKPDTSNCGYAGCDGQPNYNNNGGLAPHDTTKPTYTGGFGGPTGSIDTHSPSSGVNGVHKPDTTNCGYSGCSGQPNINENSGTTSYDTTKPNPATSSQTKPTYTGGFGGPTGTIDTHSPSSGVNGAHNPDTTNCGYPGCSGQPNINENGGTTSHDTSKPNTGSSSQTKPTYTGGFGGPEGPIDKSVPSFESTNAQKPSTTNCGPAGCNGQPTSTDTSGYTPVVPTTSYDKTKPNTDSQQKPVYTGGFGAPSGFLKPNEFSVPSTVNPPSVKSPCTTGHCTPKGAILANHNLGHSLSGAQSVSSASASANAVAYTGGFGGPPGVLKPYDEGKTDSPSQGKGGISSPNYNTPSLGAPSADGKNTLSGNNNNGGNAVAHASASSSAVAGGYGGNNGPSGGCNNGCPNNGANGDGADFGFPTGSVASAKSVAAAKSLGLGGSYASSSASAHATAGAATKGGYGRK